MVVEGSLLRQARAAGQQGTCGAEGVEPHAVDAGIMLGQFLRHVVARVVSFIQRHVLPAPAKVHAHRFRRPERIPAYGVPALVQHSGADAPSPGHLPSCTHHRVHGHGAFGRVLQLEVDGHVVGQFLALQHLHGLVVLQHLHGGHIAGVDVVGGQTVAALQQVHLLHIELLDGLAVVLYLPVVGHLDTRHTFQHIADDAVALLLIGSHEVVHCVALLADLLCLHVDLLQLHVLQLYAEIHPPGMVLHYFHLLADGKSRGGDGQRVGRAFDFQAVVPFAVGVGKTEDIARSFWCCGDVCIHRLSLRIEHSAFDHGLGVGRVE